jgi:acetylornithine deacetylase
MNTNSHFFDAINLLKEFIPIPSVSKKENHSSDFLETMLINKKYFPKRKGNNVWLLSPDWDEGKPTILLNSHIDTVKPVAGWTKDPFQLVEEDGKLFGLGSNDAGASVVSLLQVFFILSQTHQENNFIFLASCEEEISGRNGVESVLPELPPIDLGVVGEPTAMQPAVAEKGLMVLDGIVYGKAGHAAREEGENAIYKALPIIEWFQNHRFFMVSPLLGPVKMTVTGVQSGIQHNIIPDECKFTVDIRTNEFYTNEVLFKSISDTCGAEVQARSFRLNSSQIEMNHPIVQRAIDLGLVPFGSPTLSDQTFMHFPSLKIGPGESARSHTANEYIYTTEIADAINGYLELLNNLKIR